MIRDAAKAIAQQLPPVARVIRDRDAAMRELSASREISDNLIRHRDALLVELEKTREQFRAAQAMSDALARHRDELLQEHERIREEAVNPHFVNAYTARVRDLISTHPIDEAMSLAVGGAYDEVGRNEAETLCRFGLVDGMTIVDLGCGSGRLAKHLGLIFRDIRYLGVDVVQELLDYAAANSPEHFRFVLNHDLSLPAPDGSVDFVAAFSVFTHLFHEESYIYLQDAVRALRRNGSIVFSFLESAYGWRIFEDMVDHKRAGNRGHLNMFIERAQIEAWAAHLGLQIATLESVSLQDGRSQSVAVLRKC